MAISELPRPAATLVELTGASWPGPNADAVLQFARLTGDFAANLRATHDDATRAIRGIADGYQGSASEQMVASWTQLADRHANTLAGATDTLAGALRSTAGYIAGRKSRAADELAALATDAEAETARGRADAWYPAIAAGHKLIVDLAGDLDSYFITNVRDSALPRLVSTVGDLMTGLHWSRATPVTGRPSGFRLHRPTVREHAAALEQHAQSIRAHLTAFHAGIQALDL